MVSVDVHPIQSRSLVLAAAPHDAYGSCTSIARINGLTFDSASGQPRHKRRESALINRATCEKSGDVLWQGLSLCVEDVIHECNRPERPEDQERSGSLLRDSSEALS